MNPKVYITDKKKELLCSQSKHELDLFVDVHINTLEHYKLFWTGMDVSFELI